MIAFYEIKANSNQFNKAGVEVAGLGQKFEWTKVRVNKYFLTGLIEHCIMYKRV